MDKKKTGCLIKEARIRKNYTQNELGDLLGVTNKAVSRWENGDSFPDVGVLENLSEILDIRIQDIVTGEISSNDNSAVKEVVRLAKMQQLENKRRRIYKGVFALEILCCGIVGYYSLGSNVIIFSNHTLWIYMIFMLLSNLFALIGCRLQRYEDESAGISKRMYVFSAISLIWCVSVTWLIHIMILNGHMPFGMKLSLVGPFINWQLVGIYVINLVILAFDYFRNEKYDNMLSLATIYMAVFYSDMLHRMSNVDTVMESLLTRTLFVLVISLFSIVISKWIRVKK